jgi:hypothetical protein
VGVVRAVDVVIGFELEGVREAEEEGGASRWMEAEETERRA